MGEIKVRRVLLLSLMFLFFFSETILLCSANEHGSRNLAVVMRKGVKYRGPSNRNSTSSASTLTFPSSFHMGAVSSFVLALLL
ncbi:uncharacterized protein LOC130503867 [Raphanus sativus]|uniref:Uncharacterized protein LOC108841237 n=1 Tax=Raphanus sativus TaxID=3726 RepID=A0A6J0MAV6_RAPSA|nr:uncharacterized protein LOC108841237 [Raphanus sativus]XP_056854414.1 uncharacterized protein LOC130503867 [Raphanus sativus]